MALQLYHLAFAKCFFEVCKPMPNTRATSRRHRLMKTKAFQAKSQLAITYQPTIWSHDYIQVLDDNFPTKFKEKVRELEKKTVMLLNVDFENGGFTMLELLEQIDDIERLGLGYRFQNDIRRALDIIASIYGTNVGLEEKQDSLHEASLRFRILRQHDYNVSPGTSFIVYITY
ncbi:putative (E)-beta-ocimene synthase [Helianthus debilis subsp. tardiflorus]